MLSLVDGASDFYDKSEVIVLYHALNNQAFARLVLIARGFYLSFYKKNKFVKIIGFISSIKCSLTYVLICLVIFQLFYLTDHFFQSVHDTCPRNSWAPKLMTFGRRRYRNWNWIKSLKRLHKVRVQAVTREPGTLAWGTPPRPGPGKIVLKDFE